MALGGPKGLSTTAAATARVALAGRTLSVAKQLWGKWRAASRRSSFAGSRSGQQRTNGQSWAQPLTSG
eukprot:5509119-Lingulodinium_polyedra.AAC.1